MTEPEIHRTPAPHQDDDGSRVAVVSAGRLAALARDQRAMALVAMTRAATRESAGGSHRSPLRGDGTDFAEHRAYAPGDDLRKLDWRALARSDRLVVRRHETSRVLAAEFVIDVSRSMEFGTTGGDGDLPATKSEAAVFAAAWLGYRLLRQGDGVGMWAAGDGVRGFPRRRGEAQLGSWCADLAHALPATDGDAALDHGVARALARLRRPGLLIVLTDALGTDDAWVSASLEASARGHDVVVGHVMDQAERTLPYDEASRFVDPETGAAVKTHPVRVRTLYRRLFTAHVDALRRRLLDGGVDHWPIETGRSTTETMVQHLGQRRAPGGRGR